MEEVEVKRISEQYGVVPDIVRAIVGLTHPVRKMLRFQLVSYKERLQGALLTVGYKLSLSLRRRQEAVNTEDSIATAMSQTRKVLNMLNIDDDFSKVASLQPIIKILVAASFGQVKINTYRDLEDIAYKQAFRVRQATKANAIAESTARKITNKIDEVDKLIVLLDFVEKL